MLACDPRFFHLCLVGLDEYLLKVICIKQQLLTHPSTPTSSLQNFLSVFCHNYFDQ